MGFSGTVGLGAQLQASLYRAEGLPVNDGLMGPLYPIPLIFGNREHRLGFVARLFPSALEHHPCVHLVVEHPPDGGLVPEAILVGARGTSGPPPLQLIPGRVRDAPVVEHPGDLLFPAALQGPLEYLTHHLSGLRFHNQMIVVFRVLLIAVDGERSDILPLPPLQVKDHADVFRQVLQIPLVHQAVDLPSLFGALHLRINVVRHRNKADAPDGEQAMDVLFHQLHIPGEPGLALAEENLELFLPGRPDHPVEVGPQAVGPGIILVAVDVVDIPATLHSVAHQQRFLILDTLGLCFVFVLILFAQSCIYGAENVQPSPLKAQLRPSPRHAELPPSRKSFKSPRPRRLNAAPGSFAEFFCEPGHHRPADRFPVWFFGGQELLR